MCCTIIGLKHSSLLRPKTIVPRISVLALLAVGCGGSVEDGSSVVLGGPSAQKPQDETRSVFGRVRELSLGQSTIGPLLPLDSVNVCAWHDGVRCAFSSREGVFNFGDLSTGSQIEVTFSKDGYLPTVTSPDRSLGLAPTANTGAALIDAYLWVKIPGESDGQCNRWEPWGSPHPVRGMIDPAAGLWFPEMALELVRNANPPL